MNKYRFEERKKRIYRGKNIWEKLTNILSITHNVAVVILSGENACLDFNVICFIEEYVKRKIATKALILVTKQNEITVKSMLEGHTYPFDIEVYVIDDGSLELIYEYYCFSFNLDNVAFTFLNRCPYNTLGRILNETGVTEKEAACLGVYWLRRIPEIIVDV